MTQVKVIKIILTPLDKARVRNIIAIGEDNYAYFFNSISRDKIPYAHSGLTVDQILHTISIVDRRIRKCHKYKKIMFFDGYKKFDRILTRKHLNNCHSDLLEYLL